MNADELVRAMVGRRIVRCWVYGPQVVGFELDDGTQIVADSDESGWLDEAHEGDILGSTLGGWVPKE